MDHPLVERINRTGFAFEVIERTYGIDALGNEVFLGDEILEFEDEFFLVEELSMDAIQILEMYGAERKIAE